MKKIAFVLCGALTAAAFMTGCASSLSEELQNTSSADTAADGSLVKIGQNLSVTAPKSDLSFLSQNNSLAANGMYYAAWTAGEAVDYENSDGDTVDLYDAQLYLLLEESKNEDEASDNIDSWMDAAADNYDISSSEDIAINGETYTLITYQCSSETSPYDHGISAFSVHDTSAVCIELTCIESYTDDLCYHAYRFPFRLQLGDGITDHSNEPGGFLMSLFGKKYYASSNGQRLTGMARFSELLERDFKKMFLANIFTWIGFLPLIAGIAVSILSSSILVLIPAGIIGGAIAGVALSGMYDTVFRILRDGPGKITETYFRALKQNAAQSIIPGMLLGLLAGFYTFMIALMYWSSAGISAGSLVVYLIGLFIIFCMVTLYWPQIVLFSQPTKQILSNCILFTAKYFWKVLGCTALKTVYWLIYALFFPWSFMLLPFLGFWLIIFITSFILYDAMNEAYGIEEMIAEAYPEQVPYYEDDAAWAARKQEEMNNRDK